MVRTRESESERDDREAREQEEREPRNFPPDRRLVPYSNLPAPSLVTPPRTYAETLALASLFTLLAGGIGVIFTLKGELESDHREITDLKATVGKGILPITEIQLTVMAQRIADLSKALEKYETECKRQ